jgi:hypothetical protein
MIVQWCVKGLVLPSDVEARRIIDDGQGLVCNWWREEEDIDPADIPGKLTSRNLDMHINHFAALDSATGDAFSRRSPFISLSAGTVERDTFAQTNFVHRARKTALYFGSDFGMRDWAYLYLCWLILSPRPAVQVEYLAEEVRDLNSYRHYSPFQTEGEIVAKIIVPANHIASCEKWEIDRQVNSYRMTWTYENSGFVQPEMLTNVRELI